MTLHQQAECTVAFAGAADIGGLVSFEHSTTALSPALFVPLAPLDVSPLTPLAHPHALQTVELSNVLQSALQAQEGDNLEETLIAQLSLDEQDGELSHLLLEVSAAEPPQAVGLLFWTNLNDVKSVDWSGFRDRLGRQQHLIGPLLTLLDQLGGSVISVQSPLRIERSNVWLHPPGEYLKRLGITTRDDQQIMRALKGVGGYHPWRLRQALPSAFADPSGVPAVPAALQRAARAALRRGDQPLCDVLGRVQHHLTALSALQPMPPGLHYGMPVIDVSWHPDFDTYNEELQEELVQANVVGLGDWVIKDPADTALTVAFVRQAAEVARRVLSIVDDIETLEGG